MRGGPLPEGYRPLSLDGVEAFAWAGAEAWVASVLREGKTLHGWAGAHAVESLPGRGGGPVHVIAAAGAGPEGRARWAVRHYRRGGAMAPLLGDRYWRTGASRPQRELEASQRARARGVPTPAIVAGVACFHGPAGFAGVYRADLVTEMVPHARSLATLLAGHASPAADTAPIIDALRRAGGLIRALERAGVLHPDPSAGNVLLDEAGAAWVVDLDRARTDSSPNAGSGRTMLARLERSVRKLMSGSPLPGEAWAALRSGFEEGP